MHLLIVFSIVLIAWTAPAGARQVTQVSSCTCAGTYPPSPSTLNLVLQPTAATPGSTVTVSGHGCAGGVTLTVFFDTAAIGTTTTDATGAFSTTVTIPTGAGSGTNSITVSGGGCVQVEALAVTVVATKATPAAVGGVAFTGARNIYGLLEMAAGLGLLGVVLVMVSRRRRAASRSVRD